MGRSEGESLQMNDLKALTLGAGFAGQGHSEAFRAQGVKIVGMASRTKDVVDRVTKEMDIPYASDDWRQAMDEVDPDIVLVGTPGGAHYEPVLAAIERGCHVFCDKPITTSALQAQMMYRAAREKGVKTAFAASFRYQPHALLARQLVADGVIGVPWEAECVSHYNLDPLIPFGWSHRIDLGGGRLSNNFTHKLSICEHVLDGHIIAVNGEARNDMPRAPVVEEVHDFRKRGEFAPDSEDEVERWESADSEWTYTVMARLSAGLPTAQPVSTLFKHGGLQPRYQDDYVAFYGSEGAIFIKDAYAQGPLFVKSRKGSWEEVAVPASITDSLADIRDDTQRNWTRLAELFVADIRGESVEPYQMFRNGWVYQSTIDAIRDGNGWVEIAQDC
jgi:predicted dehydrogenase